MKKLFDSKEVVANKSGKVNENEHVVNGTECITTKLSERKQTLNRGSVRIVVFCIGIIMFIGAGVFYACKKDDSHNGLNNNTTLKKELIALNNDIYAKIDTSKSMQKGFSWSDFGNTLLFATADVMGAYGGGQMASVAGAAAGAVCPPAGAAIIVGGAIIGGVANSYLAYKTVLEAGNITPGTVTPGGNGGSGNLGALSVAYESPFFWMNFIN
jgi:hypothetical protein